MQMSPLAQMAQYQFQQGMAFAQQAAMAEQMMGNLPVAAQGYDQAIAMIAGSMGTAAQSGVPVPDSVFFALACSHFNAARVKAALGWLQFAPMHLAEAHQALNRAIAINPNFFQYHSAAGTVLLAEGNAALATQAFLRAVQLNPMDSWSQWMLSSLYSLQGNPGVAQQYYAAAAQIQPNLPPPQQTLAQQQVPSGDNSGKASQKDWLALINNGLTLANTIFGSSSQAGGLGGMDQMMGNASGWNFWNPSGF